MSLLILKADLVFGWGRLPGAFVQGHYTDSFPVEINFFQELFLRISPVPVGRDLIPVPVWDVGACAFIS